MLFSDNQKCFHLRFQGCYRLVVNFIVDHLTKFGIGILGVAVIHVLGVTLTCMLAKTISKSAYEEIR